MATAKLWNSTLGAFEDVSGSTIPKSYDGSAFQDRDGKVYVGSAWEDAWNKEVVYVYDDFSSDTGWTKGTGISISGGKIQVNANSGYQEAYKNVNIPITNNKIGMAFKLCPERQDAELSIGFGVYFDNNAEIYYECRPTYNGQTQYGRDGLAATFNKSTSEKFGLQNAVIGTVYDISMTLKSDKTVVSKVNSNTYNNTIALDILGNATKITKLLLVLCRGKGYVDYIKVYS